MTEPDRTDHPPRQLRACAVKTPATRAHWLTTSYATGPGGPLASKVGTTVKAYEQNLHGDVALVAATSGSITGTVAYSPYGRRDR